MPYKIIIIIIIVVVVVVIKRNDFLFVAYNLIIIKIAFLS